MPGSPLRCLLVLALPLALAACGSGRAWNSIAAAAYLDRRAQRWLDWPPAARAQGTVCLSCHTAMPYLLVRDRLGAGADYTEPAPEQRLLASVVTRVQLGDRIVPYYPDASEGSRGTEAVLNALVLADHDARLGQLRPITRMALAQMWSLQRTSGPASGSWAWLAFPDEPWEAPDSVYYGATLAALAIGRTSPAYRARPDVQAAVGRLREYLLAQSAHQPTLRRVELLWAAGSLPELLTARERDAIVAEIGSHQRSDGGWNLASLMPGTRRSDGSAEPSGSDGFATGLATLALQGTGLSRADLRVQRGLDWLRAHQNRWSGGWSSASLNHRYGLIRGGNPRHFMEDAATAFAVLALTQARADAAPRPVMTGLRPG